MRNKSSLNAVKSSTKLAKKRMRPKLLVNNNNNNNHVNIIDSHNNDESPRIAENGYRLPDPLPSGVVLTDSTKREWILGKSIGCGGFGEIYCARDMPELTATEDAKSCHAASNSYNGLPKRRCVKDMEVKRLKDIRDKSVSECAKNGLSVDYRDYPFVVKVDHICGPLYAEMHFYHRVAKPKLIDTWMLSQRLAFLGMPRYVASGIHAGNAKHGKRQKYRFLVLGSSTTCNGYAWCGP